MDSDGMETSVSIPPNSDTPSFCPVHQIKFAILGERVIRKKLDGSWVDMIEPIYECPKCIFGVDWNDRRTFDRKENRFELVKRSRTHQSNPYPSSHTSTFTKARQASIHVRRRNAPNHSGRNTSRIGGEVIIRPFSAWVGAFGNPFQPKWNPYCLRSTTLLRSPTHTIPRSFKNLTRSPESPSSRKGEQRNEPSPWRLPRLWEIQRHSSMALHLCPPKAWTLGIPFWRLRSRNPSRNVPWRNLQTWGRTYHPSSLCKIQVRLRFFRSKTNARYYLTFQGKTFRKSWGLALNEKDFLTGVLCGNPDCNTLVPIKKVYHQVGMVFKIWQCPTCGWIRESARVETPMKVSTWFSFSFSYQNTSISGP